MILDAARDLPSEIHSDVVIAGAGTVGIFLAQYLVKFGLSVVLVEAGDRVAVAGATVLGAESVGKSHAGVQFGRAAGLGGTSTLWGGQLAEFVEQDLLRDGCKWPIDFSTLKALYRRCYGELGLPDRLDDAQMREGLGIYLNQDNVEHFFTTWLPQPNFAVLFGKALRESETLRVFLRHTVCNVYFENERCCSIEATDINGEARKFSANHFILALGTIGNSQFCLSVQPNTTTPWRNNELVGAYFQDHLGGKIADVEVLDQKAFRCAFENAFFAGQKLQPKIRISAGRLKESEINICGMFSFRSHRAEQLAQAKQLLRSLRSGVYHASLAKLPASLWTIGMNFFPIVLRYLKDRRIRALFDKGVDFVVQAEQIPVLSSRISITSTEQLASGLQPVTLDWRVDGSEAETIRNFGVYVKNFLEAEGLARVHLLPELFDDGVKLLDSMSDTYHQCGGLRMSEDCSTGVTNSYGKIWGTDNLYASGASVFPSSSYANCTLTALALGIRTADNILLKERR